MIPQNPKTLKNQEVKVGECIEWDTLYSITSCVCGLSRGLGMPNPTRVLDTKEWWQGTGADSLVSDASQ